MAEGVAPGDMIISKESYNELLRDQLKLRALQNGGVDNWDWYDEAMEEYQNMLEENGL